MRTHVARPIPEPPPVTKQVLLLNLIAPEGFALGGEHPLRMQKRYRFGVATADHQCEAYNGQDDVRDVWERVRGLTPRGKATDFWNRYREDVDLARGLGCSAFRLSLSWARLEPEAGIWDESVFAHYREVLQYMRDAQMMTVVTLHHNTWPLHVQAAGNGAGLLDSHFPARMAAYASQVASRLGDLIDYYVTLNEPSQLVYGFIKGFWMRAYPMPPGLEPGASGERQMDAVLQLIPNLFRAHARAREAIRAVQPQALVGSNPLVLGLPRWLQRLVDRNATHLKSPEQARRRGKLLAEHGFVDSGQVDISIAQLTMTQKRMHRVFFSEPYLLVHLAVLHRAAASLPADLLEWKGRAGVVEDTPAAEMSGGIFTAADVRYYAQTDAAVQALREGTIDAVFHDDVMLRQYSADPFAISLIPAHPHAYGVAVALGSRSLLDAVDRALRKYKKSHPELPEGHNRNTLASTDLAGPEPDRSLEAIRKRGILRVGVRPGVEGLCACDDRGNYSGMEPDLARCIAAEIFGSEHAPVRFVPVTGNRRLNATRSPLHVFDGLRKSIGMFGTLVGTNWWNLGMAGRLPEFLCPRECVGALDFAGVDYYWGIPSFWPNELHRLSAAAECHYAMAPVWPSVLDDILRETEELFPGKPIIVIENGCVTNADGFSRARYLEAHIAQVDRAVQRGSPVVAYLCWSITSNREWGLPFDDSSDFGLYHIDLDRDPNLTRVPTEASKTYAEIIASHK